MSTEKAFAYRIQPLTYKKFGFIFLTFKEYTSAFIICTAQTHLQTKDKPEL